MTEKLNIHLVRILPNLIHDRLIPAVLVKNEPLIYHVD